MVVKIRMRQFERALIRQIKVSSVVITFMTMTKQFTITDDGEGEDEGTDNDHCRRMKVVKVTYLTLYIPSHLTSARTHTK